VAELVRHAVENAQPQIDGREHRLQLDLPDQPLTVCGDPMRLAQALSHLLINSAKFTPAGGRIEVSVRADGGSVHIHVKDSGQGIAPDFLPQVFEPFAQEAHSKPRTNGGLGVGLTIAKRLAELHGGDIHASSDGPGLGAEFVLSLPLMRSNAAAASGHGIDHPATMG
jgi:signal transduction histidine kinase